MVRLLLAISLAFAALGASAAELPAVESEDAGCPKQEAEAGKAEESATVTRPGASAPVRPRAAVRGGPRWQSLLPGMFR